MQKRKGSDDQRLSMTPGMTPLRESNRGTQAQRKRCMPQNDA